MMKSLQLGRAVNVFDFIPTSISPITTKVDDMTD